MVDFRQLVSRDTLSQIASGTDILGDRLIRSIDVELTSPIRIRASNPVSYVVAVESVIVTSPETGRSKIPKPISGIQPIFTGGTFTVPSVSGGSITNTTGSAPVTLTMSPSSNRKIGVNLNASGQIIVSLGSAGVGVVPVSQCPAVPQGCISAGYVIVYCDVSGVIQMPVNTSIYQYTSPYTESNAGATFGSVSAVSSPVYAVQSNDYVIMVNSSANAVSINLPLSSVNAGRILVVKDVGGFASMFGKSISVVPNGSENIEGANAPVVMDNSRMSLTFICDSVGWYII
jgi:hypothetical protein